MFSHASLSSAFRRAALGPQPPMDLGLGGPDRPQQMEMDDELDNDVPLPDLSVASGTLVRDVLPPAASLSSEQEGFRRDLLEVVKTTFGANASTGTVHTYEAVLRGIAPKVTLKLGSAVLPMRAEAQFYAFFGGVLMLVLKGYEFPQGKR